MTPAEPDGPALTRITASAGSGKTYALTAHFLRLLRRALPAGGASACVLSPAIADDGRPGYGWDEILAVTFTNKAAAEMKERLVQSLKERALGKGETGPAAEFSPSVAARLLGSILRHYQRLNVRTIDSLLHRLASLFALELGLTPDFSPVFEEAEVFELLFDRFVADCVKPGGEADRALLDGALDALVEADDAKGFWLRASLTRRIDAALRHVLLSEIDPGTDRPEAAAARLEELRAACREAACALSEHIDARGLAAKKFLLDCLGKCRERTALEGPPSSKMLEKESIAECLNKASQGAVTEDDEALYARLRESAAAFGAGAAYLGGALRYAPAAALAARLAERLAALSGERNMVLSLTLPHLVKNLLVEPFAAPEAYCRLGARLYHLLIDEFQDTSRDQWAALAPLALECLSKGGSLLYVGDVKQAIYGWRGGDARLFDEVARDPELAQVAPEPLFDSLPHNWRSREVIVNFVGESFGALARPDTAQAAAAAALADDAPDAERDALARTFAAVYAGSAQSLPQGRDTAGGYARVARLAPGEGDAEDEVREYLHSLLADDLLTRRAFGEIAILVRTNDQAALVSGWLIGWNVPVITENSLSLARHPLVRQLVAFLGLLDFPLNDLAVAEVLAGEEVFLAESGLTRADILDLLAAPRSGPLLYAFRERFPLEFSRHIKPFFDSAGLMGPYDILRELILAFRLLTRHKRDELVLRRFLEVAHKAEENGTRSPGAFLRLWEEKGGAERAPLSESMDAVRVMTMHKAKGLEFPVAVVPFHGSRAFRGRDPMPLSYEGATYLAPLKKAMGEPFFAKQRADILEQLNLVYVAWTRARDELYAVVEPGASGPAVRVLAALLDWPDGDAETVVERGVRPVPGPGWAAPAEAVEAEHLLPPRAEPHRLMSWLPRLRVHDRARTLYEEPRSEERLRGECLHKALEYCRTEGDRAVEAVRAVGLALEEFPALKARGPELEAAFKAVLDWLLDDPETGPWLRAGLRERELVTDEGELKRPDLLVLGRDAVTVVDFKTGSPSAAHAEQVREYMRLASGLAPARPVRGAILYLDRRERVDVAPPRGAWQPDLPLWRGDA